MASISKTQTENLRRVMRCLIDHAERTSTGADDLGVTNTVNDEYAWWPEIMEAYDLIRSSTEKREFFIDNSAKEVDTTIASGTRIILTNDELALFKKTLQLSKDIAEDNRDLFQATKEEMVRSMEALILHQSLIDKLEAPE